MSTPIRIISNHHSAFNTPLNYDTYLDTMTFPTTSGKVNGQSKTTHTTTKVKHQHKENEHIISSSPISSSSTNHNLYSKSANHWASSSIYSNNLNQPNGGGGASNRSSSSNNQIEHNYLTNSFLNNRYSALNNQEKQNFDFKLNNNHVSSLDNIPLEQFKIENKQNLPVEKRPNNFPNNLITSSPEQKKSSKQSNFIPIINNYEFNGHTLRTKKSSENPDKKIVKGDHNQQNLLLKVNPPLKMEPTSAVNLKNVIYSDNVSRQSSIRSLINNSNENNSRIYENVTKTVSQPSSEAMSNFARVKLIKAKAITTTPTKESPNSYSNNEINLLNDWDQYKNTSDVLDPVVDHRPKTRMQKRREHDGLESEQVSPGVDRFHPTQFKIEQVKMIKPHSVQQLVQENNTAPNLAKYSSFASLSALKGERNIILTNDADRDSIISDQFMNNLKFDDGNQIRAKAREEIFIEKRASDFYHDFDVNTVSDAISDDFSIHPPASPAMNGHKKTPNQPVKAKIPVYDNQNPLVQGLNPKFRVKTASNKATPNGVMKSRNGALSDEEEDDPIRYDEDDDNDFDVREENYQRLSTSINDLFANLLKELEKQKNKEYLLGNDDDGMQINPAKLNDLLLIAQQRHYGGTGSNNKSSPLTDRSEVDVKLNNNSNDSNKDSGFNQESFYNTNINSSPMSSNKNADYKSSSKPSVNGTDNEKNGGHSLENDSPIKVMQDNRIDDGIDDVNGEQLQYMLKQEQEMSLLERYLNSEQIIAYKHSQIESLLHKWLVKQNSMSKKDHFDNDNYYYSIIEYILNQEGISLRTFKKLIREKFRDIEWHDSLLVSLFHIVNYDRENKLVSAKETHKMNNIGKANNKNMPPLAQKESDDDDDDDDEEDDEDTRRAENENFDDGAVFTEDAMSESVNRDTDRRDYDEMRYEELDIDGDEYENENNLQMVPSEGMKSPARSMASPAASNEKSSNHSKQLAPTGSISKNFLTKMVAKNQISEQLNNSTNSPASSSKSYKRIKDIKNSTNLKKKLSSENSNSIGGNINSNSQQVVSNQSSAPVNHHHTPTYKNLAHMYEFASKSMILSSRYQSSFDNQQPEDEEEAVKQMLSTSFIKRRDRKGSLPEITPSHIVNGVNGSAGITSPTNLNNNNAANLYSTIGSEYEEPLAVDATSPLSPNKNGLYSPDASTLQNESIIIESGSQRRSLRKTSAFVLEVARMSMFKSKSMTDLSNSLVKFDNPHAASNAHMSSKNSNNLNSLSQKSFVIGGGLGGGTTTNSQIDFNDLFFNINGPIKNNYIGLIWQCADMAYKEYRDKYIELHWLMTGDNVSAALKLKELEQRLKIEFKLKKKTVEQLELLRQRNLQSSRPNDEQRLVGQLKVINMKIKEMEMTRLFIRVCEINNFGLDESDLDKFFTAPIANLSNKAKDNNNQLQAKSIEDIFKNVYGRDALCSGFVYQFFVVYRYICSSMQLFEFFKENFQTAYNCNTQPDKTKIIMERTIDLVAMWLDGFYIIDFQQHPDLFEEMEKFIEVDIKEYDEEKAQILYNLLHYPNIEFNLFVKANTPQLNKIKNIMNKQGSQEPSSKKMTTKTVKKRFLFKNALYGSSAKKSAKGARSKSTDARQDDLNSTLNSVARQRGAEFYINDHADDLIVSQLTLIEWDNFLDIHVCHCLNSKAQGVNCDTRQPIDPNHINAQTNLFVDNYLSKSLYKMIQFNYLVTHWATAEILLQQTTKGQTNMIVKFLKIAHQCCECFNFSSAFSIFDGLQDITVRNLPAWQHVPSKAMHHLEKIASYRRNFQNEPFVIYKLSKTTTRPIIPSMHYFLLNVQQSELGSFQLANGLWKWAKLGLLANLVDQIRNIQQHYICEFEPNEDFVEDLLQRIYYVRDFDIQNLAENSILDYQSLKLNQSHGHHSMSTIRSFLPKTKSPKF